jgi:hypothetical protein
VAVGVPLSFAAKKISKNLPLHEYEKSCNLLLIQIDHIISSYLERWRDWPDDISAAEL